MKYHLVQDPFRTFHLLFGGKWRLLIIKELLRKTQRFGELKKNVQGITPRMLTQELVTLTKYNLIEKNVFREVPPRVEYSLSDEGITLYPLLEVIENAGEKYMEKVQKISDALSEQDNNIVKQELEEQLEVQKVQRKPLKQTTEEKKAAKYVQLELF